jgi:hypothetical protein
MSNQAQQKLSAIKAELARREREVLRVYRPSVQQSPMHQSSASEVIVRGGKRAGKSVCVSAEFASRVTGEPILSPDGSVILPKYPVASPDYPRIYWIIGWDTKHIGQTIHRLLFQRGQGGTFRVIQDEATGQWRTFNRADAKDRARIKESELAEPLIPERLIEPDSWEWEDKKANHFNRVRLRNGATIFAYPSSARNPKQGDAVSGIWIDEDIQFPGHLREWQDRLTDEEGWFIWSVWPHMKNEALLDLINRAEVAELDDSPQIQSFTLVMTENPHLTDKGKKESLGRMGSDEEIARRNEGALLTDALSMYQFSGTMHQIQRPLAGRIIRRDQPKAHKFLLDLWLQSNTFPRDWTRYLSIDPSNTRTAVLSWVVPPPECQGVKLGNIAICEWELIARRFSAKMLAKAIMDKVGTRHYESFVMDQMAGRQTHAGREETTFGIYAEAFAEVGLSSRLSLNSFVPGCNVRAQRFRAVRDLLEPQFETGIPSMMIVEETCTETRKEFNAYRKKTEARGEGVDSVLDEPANPRLFDCMAAVEYFAAYIQPMFIMGQAFVEPTLYNNRGSAAYRHAKKIINKQRHQEDADVVTLG